MRPKEMDDIFMVGIEPGTYKKLLEIAKRQGVTVGEVVSSALGQKILQDSGVQESSERQVLLEG